MAFRVPSGSATIFCSTDWWTRKPAATLAIAGHVAAAYASGAPSAFFVLFDKAPRSQERAERLRREAARSGEPLDDAGAAAIWKQGYGVVIRDVGGDDVEREALQRRYALCRHRVRARARESESESCEREL